MVRWLVVLTLSVVSSTASGQSGQSTHLAVATDNARTTAKDADLRVSQLALHRTALAKRYQEELDAIDRLKKQRASWRRDRELRDSLSTSAETANELSAATHDLEKANAALGSARRAYLLAIDTERTAGAVPLRALQLDRARGLLTPLVKDAPRRIVFPDLEVDPLADPEELDQRAAELRASEDELSRQLVGLDTQATELEHLALLRKEHDRAGDLLNRDDDQARRNTTHKAGDSGGVSEDGVPIGGIYPSSPGVTPPGFDNSVPIVLADVIDASTIKSLTAAQSSGDPAQRAEAARKAHLAVAGRLEQVRKKRTEIEARSKQLRGQR
jgi:hypothetical protein